MNWSYKIKGPGCYLYEGERAIGQVEGVDRARLMVAAPKLLDACRQLLHVCEGDQQDEAFDWVRDVIAEAVKGGAA